MNDRNEGYVQKTPDHELQRILSEQQIEGSWWQELPQMHSDDDIEAAVTSGRAIQVPADAGIFRVSTNAPVEYNVLHPRALSLLTHIAEEWKKTVEDPSLFLVVTSLARTEAYQKVLQQKGYPTAERSSHTKLVAFDIGIAWMQKNEPEAYDELMKIVLRLREQGALNAVLEPTIGVLHLCVSPSEEG